MEYNKDLFEEECKKCSNEYKQKFHCPRMDSKTDSTLMKIACQIEHAKHRERGDFI